MNDLSNDISSIEDINKTLQDKISTQENSKQNNKIAKDK